MPRILIIDDDPQICKTLSEILEGDGHEVKAVQSSEEGIKNISKGGLDIVVVDLVMPKISGMEVLTHLKRSRPEVPVIMITAFGTIENAVEAMRKGASDYISKPFKIDEIQASIRRVLEEVKFIEMERKAELSLPEGVVKEDVQNILGSLANPIRRGVVELLGDRDRVSFTQIKNNLKIEDPTKLSFHLRKLKQSGMVEQDENKAYLLSKKGIRAIEVLRKLERPKVVNAK